MNDRQRFSTVFHPFTLIFFLLIAVPASFLYIRFFHDTRYIDLQSNCDVLIEASTLYRMQDMYAAIALIKEHNPERYSQFCSYVTVIAPTDECPSVATACAHLESHIGFVRSNYGKDPYARNDVEGLAGTLVHEICHFHQGRTEKDLPYNQKTPSPVREAECTQAGQEFMRSLY